MKIWKIMARYSEKHSEGGTTEFQGRYEVSGIMRADAIVKGQKLLAQDFDLNATAEALTQIRFMED